MQDMQVTCDPAYVSAMGVLLAFFAFDDDSVVARYVPDREDSIWRSLLESYSNFVSKVNDSAWNSAKVLFGRGVSVDSQRLKNDINMSHLRNYLINNFHMVLEDKIDEFLTGCQKEKFSSSAEKAAFSLVIMHLVNYSRRITQGNLGFNSLLRDI